MQKKITQNEIYFVFLEDIAENELNAYPHAQIFARSVFLVWFFFTFFLLSSIASHGGVHIFYEWVNLDVKYLNMYVCSAFSSVVLQEENFK